jgi:hypothetical protein
MARRAPIERLRAICLALPGAGEKLSHGEPSFFAGKMFATFASAASHHGAGRDAVWCAAPEGAQDVLVSGQPDRYFVPPYVGHRGWLGAWLDDAVDWDEIASVIEDAYRCVAPRRLVAALEAAAG